MLIDSAVNLLFPGVGTLFVPTQNPPCKVSTPPARANSLFEIAVGALFSMCLLAPLSVRAELDDGLVAHYQFEGNADDSVGVYDGVEKNGVAYLPGAIGQAASFDGQDDYIALPSFDHVLNYDKDWTIGLWVKLLGKSNRLYAGSDGGSGATIFSLNRTYTKICAAQD